jgi:hypothetical protein
MNIATSLRHAPWSTDTIREYKFRRTNQMCADPSLIKRALGLPAIWYGYPWSDPRDGGEDIEQLENLAFDKLERQDLTALEVADLESALTALDDFRQQRRAND